MKNRSLDSTSAVLRNNNQKTGKFLSMDGSPGGGFSGHIQHRFDSSGPLRAPHFERRGDNRLENRYLGPTGQPGGRGRGTHPITPQVTVVNQGHFSGPSFSPAPYANPVNNNTDRFFYGTRQGALSNASPPRHPPTNHHYPHSQSSQLISGHPAFNVGGSYNMDAAASRTFPPDVTRATQEGIGGSVAQVGSIQPPAHSPQAGSIDIFRIQRRRVHSLPCPVSGCPSSLSRTQDQRRHLLTHLPHWIHCPAPDCFWRGDRLNAFVRHWGNDHHHPTTGSTQVPNEDQCKTFDPQPLMKAISEGFCIQAAQKHAISMVKKRALELRKPELSENPWGSKWKRQKNSDPRHMVPTS
ncbi:hypothetical protein F5888DRAFT_629022 [Russula emetica]|nr:hypothetical protein F5888DRAFT_629022 [Russula emetica]